jgi:hypothetical protein
LPVKQRRRGIAIERFALRQITHVRKPLRLELIEDRIAGSLSSASMAKTQS